MLILAIETSGDRAGVALLEDDRLLLEETITRGVRAGAGIVPAVEKVLRSAGREFRSVDLYAVDVGPGSFTGTRVGIGTVKAFALSHPKPAVGVSSLEALASLVSGVEGVIVPLLHSNRDVYHAARFEVRRGHRVRLAEDRVIREKDISSLPAGDPQASGQVRSVGTGWKRLPTDIMDACCALAECRAEDLDATPTAAAVGRVAWEHFRAGLAGAARLLRPTYLQSPV